MVQAAARSLPKRKPFYKHKPYHQLNKFKQLKILDLVCLIIKLYSVVPESCPSRENWNVFKVHFGDDERFAVSFAAKGAQGQEDSFGI